MIYRVEVKEVYIQTYEVNASSPEEAKEKIYEKDNYLIDGDFEYSHTMDQKTWVVKCKK